MSISRRAHRPTIILAALLLAPSVFAVPGDLLSITTEGRLSVAGVEELTDPLFDGSPDALYEVDVYWVSFETTDLDGSAAEVRAQLFVPVLDDPEILPLYVFGPGSTGLVNPCRPSREHIAGIRWGLYRAHVVSHVAQGAIGVLPDYVGFEDAARIQPYFVAVSEGRMMLDAVRAAQRFYRTNPTPAIPSPRAILAGYSQGGHAAFAAADLRATYAPELQLGGIIGYGATTDMRALFLEFVVSAPLVIHVYSQLYGTQQFNPRAILQDRWADSLSEDVTTQCIGGIQSYYPWDPAELYRPAFLRALRNDELERAYPRIHEVLRANSTGLTGHGVPALLLQGTEDIVVREASQARFARRLCGQGSRVLYRVFEGARHDTRQIGFNEVRDWMRERVRGIVAPANCASLEDQQ